MIRVINSQQAEEDLDAVLKRSTGEEQAREYLQLVHDAIAAIAKNPACVRSYRGVQLDILSYLIRQFGKHARHLLFYRIAAPGNRGRSSDFCMARGTSSAHSGVPSTLVAHL